MSVLDELQQAVNEVKAANLPEYAERLRKLEVRMKDIEDRLSRIFQPGAGRR